MTASTEIESDAARARSRRASPLQAHGKSLLTIPRVRTFLNRMIEGDDIKAACKAANITTMRGRILLHDAAVRRAYFKGMEVLRDSERARNIHLATKLRDDGFGVAATAAAKKVALEAARYLDGDDGRSGANPSVSVTVNTVVGYVMDLREDGDHHTKSHDDALVIDNE